MNQKIFPDCLIVDVDGVLMEALASFPEMIRIVFEEEWADGEALSRLDYAAISKLWERWTETSFAQEATR